MIDSIIAWSWAAPSAAVGVWPAWSPERRRRAAPPPPRRSVSAAVMPDSVWPGIVQYTS